MLADEERFNYTTAQLGDKSCLPGQCHMLVTFLMTSFYNETKSHFVCVDLSSQVKNFFLTLREKKVAECFKSLRKVTFSL